MFVRTTELSADPARIDDGIAHVRDDTFPTVSDIDGCEGMSLLVDRESGHCIATTAWRSEDAMRESAERVLPLRTRAEETLGAEGSEVSTWEVAVVHRDHATPEGACARLTWISGPAETIDRLVDTYRMAVLPRIQEMTGFCSASLMVDRTGGRAVGTLALESREDLEASRDEAKSIRERVTSEIGARVDRVDEMEIAFAHLHVPEMA